nr:TonB-dependent receptor [Alteraurantiacibacter aestuarii]
MIFVTGSRIRRDEFSSPAPLTVVDPEIAVRKGLMDTGEMIQGSPIAAGSSQITSAISSNFVTNGGSGAQTISLRGLGAERTLVLLNGRRAGPAGTRGAVSAFDLNVLPQSIVQRVDILKDGASSIYGSDAVAGVVNLITKTDTDGVEFDFFGSVPFESGGESWSASATWGTTFDRGHILASVNYYRRNELTRGDRDYLGCPEAYVFTDTTLTSRADLIDPRTGQFACNGESDITWGHVWTYDGADLGSADGTTNIPNSPGGFSSVLLQYDYPGDNLGATVTPNGPVQFAGQIGTPPGWYNVSNSVAGAAVTNNYHPLMDFDTVIPQTDRYTVYVDGAYELTSNMELYGEFLYNKRKNYVNASRQIWGFGYGETFDYSYYYDGYLYEGGFAGDPRPSAQGWSGYAVFSPTAYTDQFDSWQEVDYMRGVLGVRGDISDNWGYDIYGQWSRSDGDYSQVQTFNDSILDYNYYLSDLCEGTTVGAGTPYERPCVDVRLFDPYFLAGEFTPEEVNFLFGTETGNTVYEQKYVEAIVSGEVFELPGGPLGLALGVQYREDTIDDNPGYITQNANAWSVTTAGRTAGRVQTKEAFGEISLPLLSDIPFIESFTLTAAGRLTNVSARRTVDGQSDSDNGNFTYKLGADWELTDWFRVRGTYGTSFRAPALFEQFLADQTSSLGQRVVDPCIQWQRNLDEGAITQQFADNCAADGVGPNHLGQGISATIFTGGQVGRLDPETSTAWTVSAIFEPTLDFLPNTQVSLAVDYFEIEVNDEIAQLGGFNVLAACYGSDFFPEEPLCDLFARNQDLPLGDPRRNSGLPANVAFITDDFLNVARQENHGVDVTARLVHDFAGDVTLTIQGQMTWQTTDVVELFPGSFEDSNGESGEPRFVGDFRVQLDTGPWSLFYGLDVIGATDDIQDYVDNNGVDAGGNLCYQFTTYPNPVCLDLTQSAKFYHSVSVTREIGDNFEITAGISNLTDVRPPRTSNVGGDGITQFGLGAFQSQYDLLGRRAFVNLNIRY